MVINPDLLAIAEHLVTDANLDDARLATGQFHDVVLLPGVAAVRIARREAAAVKLPRRTELLAHLAVLDLPFAVPAPLGAAQRVDGRMAVAVSWVDGAGQAKNEGDPRRLAELLEALAGVDCAALADVLAEPHEYAGGHRWADVMFDEVVPRLPEQWQDEARRRIDAALALEPVPPALVHGDLGGENVHWDPSGKLIGVLDWDLASAFDPAIDAACLGWHGWDNIRQAVDAETFRRARTWYLTFGVEQLGAAVVNGEPPEVVERYVSGVVAFLERT